MAIEPGHIDPFSFALIRVAAGSMFLLVVVLLRGGRIPWRGGRRVVGAASLLAYMVGFSVAYVSLDAGTGALILFGVVQISMFTYSSFLGAKPTVRQVIGAFIAFTGLGVALWPEAGQAAEPLGSFAMVVAGLGWAAYSLSGKNARNPLAETAANFIICLPVLLLLTVFLFHHVTLMGGLLAVLCGAVTSGLGYALWYAVLPALDRNIAAVVQLSVPIIAILAGAVLLSEPVTLGVLIAAGLVISGIAMAVTKRSPQGGRS